MTCTDSKLFWFSLRQERIRHTGVKRTRRKRRKRRKRSVAPPPAIQPRPPCNWPDGVLVSWWACVPSQPAGTEGPLLMFHSRAQTNRLFHPLQSLCTYLPWSDWEPPTSWQSPPLPLPPTKTPPPFSPTFYCFLCCCFLKVSLLHAGWIWVTHYLIYAPQTVFIVRVTSDQNNLFFFFSQTATSGLCCYVASPTSFAHFEKGFPSLILSLWPHWSRGNGFQLLAKGVFPVFVHILKKKKKYKNLYEVLDFQCYNSVRITACRREKTLQARDACLKIIFAQVSP